MHTHAHIYTYTHTPFTLLLETGSHTALDCFLASDSRESACLCLPSAGLTHTAIPDCVCVGGDSGEHLLCGCGVCAHVHAHRDGRRVLWVLLYYSFLYYSSQSPSLNLDTCVVFTARQVSCKPPGILHGARVRGVHGTMPDLLCGILMVVSKRYYPLSRLPSPLAQGPLNTVFPWSPSVF